MGWWRRYLDLWIVGALLCGLFAFRHGGVTLASVGPRVGEFTTFLTAKFAEFTSVAPPVVDGEANLPPVNASPAADDIAPATPEIDPLSIDPVSNVSGPNQLWQTPLGRPLPGPGFVPFCPEPYGHRCSR